MKILRSQLRDPVTSRIPLLQGRQAVFSKGVFPIFNASIRACCYNSKSGYSLYSNRSVSERCVMRGMSMLLIVMMGLAFCIGCGGDCEAICTRCAPSFAANINRRPVRGPIRSCTRWNICKPSSHAAGVRWRPFNGIFSVRFWVERVGRCGFFPQLRPQGFPDGVFQVGDNTTIPSAPAPTDG